MIHGVNILVGMRESILNHFWQSAAVTLLVWVLTALLKNNRASVRYVLWMIASVKFLVPFSLLISAAHLIQSATTVAPHASKLGGLVLKSVQPYTISASSASTVISYAGTAAPAADRIFVCCFWMWAVGTIVMLVLWFRSWLFVYRTVHHGLPVGEVAGIPLLECEGQLEPGVFGMLRPRILIPGDILSCVSAHELQTIYSHEICHIRRRDNFTAALHSFVHAIFWIHPAVWLIRSKLLDERERACDEYVIASGNNAEVYARSILNVCRFYVETDSRVVAGVSGGKLTQRILRIATNLSCRRLTI